jgi:hypothetical protein
MEELGDPGVEPDGEHRTTLRDRIESDADLQQGYEPSTCACRTFAGAQQRGMMGMLTDVGRVLRRLRASSVVLDRLRTDIGDFEAQYSGLLTEALETSGASRWADAVQRHIKNARSALEEFEVDSGYQSLLNAERDAIALMSDLERSARLVTLRAEVADKLGTSWRGKGANALLENGSNVSVEDMREVLFQLNTHSQNGYRKLALLRRQLNLVGLMVMMLVITAVATVLNGWVPGIEPEAAPLFATAVFAGLLGGTLSAAFSSIRIRASAKIPAVQRSALITLTRTFIGAAAAIPTFALLKGGLLDLAVTNDYALLFFCFFSGFSERWFLEKLDQKGQSAVDQSSSSVALHG